MDRRDALRALCAAPAAALLGAGRVEPAPARAIPLPPWVLEPDVQPPPATGVYAESDYWPPVVELDEDEARARGETPGLAPAETCHWENLISLEARRELVRRNLSLEWLADAMFWNRAEVRGWFEGRHSVGINMLGRLAVALDWDHRRVFHELYVESKKVGVRTPRSACG